MSINKFEFVTSLYVCWMLATVLTEIKVLETIGIPVKEYYEVEYQKKNYSSTGGLIRILFVVYWIFHVVPNLTGKLIGRNN